MEQQASQPEMQFVASDWSAVPDVHRFAHQAMATTFEVVIQHEDRSYAQQTARAAFDEVDRIEGYLSRFLETSDVTRINHLPAGVPAQLSLDAFECLRISAEASAQTGGAFDVTVGFLVDCWVDKARKRPRTPSAKELEFARAHTGMNLILLDEPTHAVALTASPVRVDLGGIGKGYAVDRMAELLREWSIDRALIHGGFSSVLALDAPQGRAGWPVTLSHPNDRRRTLARVALQGMSVSGSGLEKGRHIIDPRTGTPAESKIAAWSLAPDATRADVLSTAFMVMTPEEVKEYCADHPKARALLVLPDGPAGSAERIMSAGAWKSGELVA
ncbi:MAG: FAD:protein FMN transferase [Planctomycetes bacterium]|jgi:thiamine biosynthesis lipoprotein|nr:FAD:protein FMN transferase [Planctomycetota bacterium]